MDPEKRTKWVNILYDIIQQYGLEIDQIVDNKKAKRIIYVHCDQINIGKKLNDKNSIQIVKINDPGGNELVVLSDTETNILTFKSSNHKAIMKTVLDRFLIN